MTPEQARSLLKLPPKFVPEQLDQAYQDALKRWNPELYAEGTEHQWEAIRRAQEIHHAYKALRSQPLQSASGVEPKGKPASAAIWILSIIGVVVISLLSFIAWKLVSTDKTSASVTEANVSKEAPSTPPLDQTRVNAPAPAPSLVKAVTTPPSTVAPPVAKPLTPAKNFGFPALTGSALQRRRLAKVDEILFGHLRPLSTKATASAAWEASEHRTNTEVISTYAEALLDPAFVAALLRHLSSAEAQEPTLLELPDWLNQLAERAHQEVYGGKVAEKQESSLKAPQ